MRGQLSITKLVRVSKNPTRMRNDLARSIFFRISSIVIASPFLVAEKLVNQFARQISGHSQAPRAQVVTAKFPVNLQVDIVFTPLIRFRGVKSNLESVDFESFWKLHCSSPFRFRCLFLIVSC